MNSTTASRSVSSEPVAQTFTKNPIDSFKLQEKITNEEYKIWKKTVPLLYESIQVHVMPYSTTTFRWIPGGVDVGKDTLSASFLMTKPGSSSTVFQVGTIELPSTFHPSTRNAIEPPIAPNGTKFKVVKEIETSEQLYNCKINMKNRLVAGFCGNGVVQSHGFLTGDASSASLVHHRKTGALEWQRGSDDTLLTCGDDDIALWDVTRSSSVLKTYDFPYCKDVSWNAEHRHIFGAVGGTRSRGSIEVTIYDSRSQAPAFSVDSPGTTHIEFHPTMGSVLATSSGKIASIWDIRYFRRPFRSLFGIVGDIEKLQFDPSQANILSTLTKDKRIYVWDLSEIDAGDFDEEIYAKDPESEDPCLRFIHGGHTSRINDFDIHGELFNVYGSVGEDSLVEVWRPFFVVEEEEANSKEEKEEEKEEEKTKEEKEEKEDEKEEEDEEEEEEEEAQNNHAMKITNGDGMHEHSE